MKKPINWAGKIKGRKRHKYGVNKEKARGYDSIREANRADQLKWMEKAGEISELREQVRYDLAPSFYVEGVDGKPVCVHKAMFYKADFVYIKNGAEIVEDAKGVRTEEYKKKKNLMRRIHGIEIKET
jgi:hypothetical protein